MPPLANNLTDRYFLDYEGPAGQHTVLFRFAPSAVQADAIDKVEQVATAMAPFLTPDTTFHQLRVSQSGTLVSFPVAWTPIDGTSEDTMTPEEYPNFVSWVGRDQSGVRVRWTLQGIPLNPDADYRIPAGDNVAVQAVLSALSGGAALLVTASGAVPILNQYANFGRNAYFQRQRRRVG